MTSKFKVNDIVRVKPYDVLTSELTLDNIFPTWMGKSMECQCGKEFVIADVNESGGRFYYSLAKIGTYNYISWAWAECLLESADQDAQIEITMSLDELI